MNELELLTLYNELIAHGAQHYIHFLSGLFAIVVTAYFAADKLPGFMVWVIVALFVIFTANTSWGVAHSFAQATELAGIFRDQVANSSNIFHPMSRVLLPESLNWFILVAPAVTIWVASVSGMIYFLYARTARTAHVTVKVT